MSHNHDFTSLSTSDGDNHEQPLRIEQVERNKHKLSTRLNLIAVIALATVCGLIITAVIRYSKSDESDQPKIVLKSYHEEQRNPRPRIMGYTNIYVNPYTRAARKLRFPVVQYEGSMNPFAWSLTSHSSMFPFYADRRTKQSVVYSDDRYTYVMPSVKSRKGRVYSVAELVNRGRLSFNRNRRYPSKNFEMNRYFTAETLSGSGIPRFNDMGDGFGSSMKVDYDFSDDEDEYESEMVYEKEYEEKNEARYPPKRRRKPQTNDTVSAFNVSNIAKIYKESSDSLSPTGRVVISGNIIYRLGRPVLTGRTKVYIVYYGTWTTTEKNIINNFINVVSSTTWFNIERKYYYQASSTSAKVYTVGPAVLAGAVNNNYSKGKSLNNALVVSIISNYLQTGVFPKDSTAIYLLLSAGDVTNTDGLCTAFCGYHSYLSISGLNYPYSYVGKATACPSACVSSNNYPKSVNNNPVVDGLVSVVAHELVEAMSDPFLNAWFDAAGYENADKCAWEFGTMSTFNGAKYNVAYGSYKYLIQKNWNPVSQSCAISA